MAIIYQAGQVAVSDPSPTGPNAAGNIKDVLVKSVKLTSANFSTGGTNTLVAVLAADASLLMIQFMVETQLSGGGITAATIDIGTASGGAQIVSAANAFGTAGTNALLNVLGGPDHYNVPLGADKQIFVKGTATTGNPTGGELYMNIYYVR